MYIIIHIDLPSLQSLSVGYLGMMADHIPKAENGRELTGDELEDFLFENTLIMQCIFFFRFCMIMKKRMSFVIYSTAFTHAVYCEYPEFSICWNCQVNQYDLTIFISLILTLCYFYFTE